MNISELVIYRNLKHEELFEDMAGLMGLGNSEKKADAFVCAGQLVELAVEYGFEGNLWHCFLALCLADNENAYTTTCDFSTIHSATGHNVFLVRLCGRGFELRG